MGISQISKPIVTVLLQKYNHGISHYIIYYQNLLQMLLHRLLQKFIVCYFPHCNPHPQGRLPERMFVLPSSFCSYYCWPYLNCGHLGAGTYFVTNVTDIISRLCFVFTENNQAN